MRVWLERLAWVGASLLFVGSIASAWVWGGFWVYWIAPVGFVPLGLLASWRAERKGYEGEEHFPAAGDGPLGPPGGY